MLTKQSDYTLLGIASMLTNVDLEVCHVKLMLWYLFFGVFLKCTFSH